MTSEGGYAGGLLSRAVSTEESNQLFDTTKYTPPKPVNKQQWSLKQRQEATEAREGWKDWHDTYDKLADKAPLVPNPSVWGYSRAMDGNTSDYHIPGGKEMTQDKPEPPSYRKEVGGVLVGYSGHVPRSRDKVGGTSLGGVNDLESKYRTLAQTFRQRGIDPPEYLSETRSCGNTGRPLEQPKLWDAGIKTGFGGHMPGAKYIVGSSIYSLEKTEAGHKWMMQDTE